MSEDPKMQNVRRHTAHMSNKTFKGKEFQFVSFLQPSTTRTQVMRHLNQVEAARTVTLLQGGQTFYHKANMFQVYPSVILCLRRQFQGTGKYTQRAGQSQGRITTANHNCYIVLSVFWRHQSTSRTLQMLFEQQQE